MIQAAAAKSNLKKVLLELGGKSAAIIFEDADVEEAVKQTAHSIQLNSGQVCIANSRVYVQDTIADRYIELFEQYFEKEVTMGDPLDKGTNHGTQADEVQHKTVLQYALLAGQLLGDQDGLVQSFLDAETSSRHLCYHFVVLRALFRVACQM